jgi:hypothetical protein
MFDDLRKDSDASPFFQEEESEPLLDAKPKKKAVRQGVGFKLDDKFLGMTAFQRFILSIMLLMVVCVLGMMFLLVAGKIVLPL